MAGKKKSGGKPEAFKVIEVTPEDLGGAAAPRVTAWGVHQDKWPGSSAAAAPTESRVVIRGEGADAPVFVVTTTTVVQVLPPGSDVPRQGSAWNQSDTWPGSSASVGEKSKSAWVASDVWPGSSAKAQKAPGPKKRK